MKITVVTPSFNQEEFIERTILSVISQSWDFELEYIIMDWWSTDWSVGIIKKYEEMISGREFLIKCKKVEFIWKSEKDKWQSDAINKGLRLATWDILTYLNSDDTYEPWALEKVAGYLGNSISDWCYGKCKIIDKDDAEIREWITLYKNVTWAKYSYAKLLSENFISQMTVFWKKRVIDAAGLFNVDEHLCMDYEYWLRLWKLWDPVYIPHYIANFRFYQTSKSWSRFDKQFSDELRIATKYAAGKYRFSLLLHKFNYYKIVFVYKLLSLLKI
ncbi:MAG: glycosyl transferase family 2 [uncultured bacterium (gcode 4)]|uniref:Glycosyl transferase family 2 n=1 Tax=uncultured bacterium (gcode 4) TaxID=1234023 RepID=K2H0K8_9BACT|nr:MAG: glycosyl transferase family 2 [uncultured bacterium (gcode 4)]